MLGALLRLAHQAVAARIGEKLAEAGFDDAPASHFVMTQPLWQQPEGVRATELAARARITKQSIGALVDQMVERGYVERIDDPADRRAKLVRLTEHGMALARTVRSEVRAIEADWAVRFGEKRIAAMRETLALIVSGD